MSLICNPCHVIETGHTIPDRHFPILSYGSCETCGFRRNCIDCKCPVTSTPLNDTPSEWSWAP